MVGHPLRGLKRTLRNSRGALHARRRTAKQPWFVESLEDRLLLSGNPTIFTVNSTGNSTTGTGDSGTLPYVIGQANANTNTAGSEIQFDPTVFASPQTITLASTLVLSETAGPEVIDGPGTNLVTVSGNNAVEVFSVTNGVTASLTGLSISGGLAPQGGGLSVVGATVSLTKVAVTNNRAVGSSGGFGGPEPGGIGLGGGIYLNGGSLTLNDDTVAHNVSAGVGSGVSGSSSAGARGSAAGGGIYVASGSLVLNNDLFQSNQAAGGSGQSVGGPGMGGGIYNAGTMKVTNSTFSSNSAGGGFGAYITGGNASGGAISNTGVMSIAGSTLSGNSATGGGNIYLPDSSAIGGAISNTGLLSVTNSTIAGNSAAVAGGGVNNNGTMTVTNCTIINNSSNAEGAHDVHSGYGQGGGIFNSDTVTVTNSTIADNASISAGGVANFGAMTVTNSTIAGNSALFAGGGINNGGTLTVTNSTITGNSATLETVFGYTFVGGGGINNGGTLIVVSSTIAYNNVAVFGEGGGLDGTAILDNTIVALNTIGSGTTTSASDIFGTVSSTSGYNLIGTGGSGGLTNGTNHNQVGVANPGLGPLADNGGPTQTIALLPGSPAIDKGSNALAVDPTTGQPLTTDQRGPGFVRIVNGTVDIGAYEFTPAANDTLAVTWGTQTAALQTAADGFKLLPAGRTTDIPWLGIDQLPITLSKAYALTAADVYISSAIGVNYGPVTVSGSGTNYTITLARPINAADVITIIIDNPGVSVFYHQFDVLPGDFNDDGVVNSQDLVGVRNEWLGIGGAKPTIFGDIIGNGTVNVADYNAERLLIGTSLPSVSDALIAPGTGSQVGLAVVRIGAGNPSARVTASRARLRAEIQLSGRGSSLRTLTRGKTINQRLIERSISQDATV